MKRIRGKVVSADYTTDLGETVIKVKMDLSLNKAQYLELIEKSNKNEVSMEILQNE